MSIRKEHLKNISSAGGKARIRMHGNPGTTEGRKRGGRSSIKTHSKGNTAFKLLRKVATPRYSINLAEIIGILMGDGHVGIYQTSVTTNSQTDTEHLLFIESLFKKIFKEASSRIHPRKGQRAIVLTISSKEVGRILVKMGMVYGNKLNGDLHMPAWIRKVVSFQHAWVRGLFDTDGCVFIDHHHYKKATYRNIGISFSSRSLKLLRDFNYVLQCNGLRTTQTSKFAIFLRRKEDVQRYFQIFGTSNPKHRKKFDRFFNIETT